MTILEKKKVKRPKHDSEEDSVPAKKVKKEIIGKQVKKSKPGFKGNKKVKKEPLPKDTAKSRKERKLMRKKWNPNYELSHKAKKIWEKLRIQKNELAKEEKLKLVEELMNLVKEQNKKLISICYAHDTSRVVQTCLKQGSREQRHRIFADLKRDIVDMCKNGYAKNIVWKMLKYGTPQEREAIMNSFKGNAYRMIRRPRSASVVEYAYNNYATAQQRNLIVRQLYGKVFRLCENSEASSLSEILANQPDKKESILTSFKHSLEPFVDKAVIKHTVVHKAFYDFFQNCDNANLRNELIEILRESLIHMMHTHDGAHVTMQCLWHGTRKDRKVIIKTMKEFVLKLSCEEFGHLPILAAFDCVDDTVFIKKALVSPLIKDISELASNKYGRKILLYLLSPRNPSHFLPETIKLLSSGDDNPTSKKPMSQRHRELTEGACGDIVNHVTDHIEDFIFDHSLFVLIEAAYLCLHDDKASLTEAILGLMTKKFTPNHKDENDRLHVVEDPCGHMVIKRLIMAESKRKKEDETKDCLFSRSILDKIPGKNLATWCACNRGTQIILALVESTDQDVASTAQQSLKENLKVIKKNSSVKSTKILLQKFK